MYDLIGVGFGPANLALAIAIDDHNRHCPDEERIEALFLERSQHFAWHPGMLLPHTTMQISFLKDLVSFRDVTHPLSFLSYLQHRGRLDHFVNKQTFFPSRAEFSDYLGWAADQVSEQVRYGAEVRAARVDPEDRSVVVELADGEQLHARAAVLAPGLQPRLPEGVSLSDRVIHTSQTVHALQRLTRPVRTAVVVGAGQSAAEVVRFLHERDTGTTVHSVFAKVGYTPADDSPFVNRIFDPDMVDRWHGAPEDVRRRLFDYHRGTNYSAVDPELVEALYDVEYEERVSGHRRLFMDSCSEVVAYRETPDAVEVDVRDLTTGETTTLEADLVVFASGYRPADPAELFGPDARWYRHEGTAPAVARDYQWIPADESAPPVYLNGGVEHTHGLSSSLLSNLAVRGGEIVDSVVAARAAQSVADAVDAVDAAGAVGSGAH